MKHPEGFRDNPGMSWRLIKSLYGLKQSGRCWNHVAVAALKRAGLTQSESDPCFFYRKGERKILLTLYVDDGLIAARYAEDIDELLTKLQEDFQLTKSDADSYLGCEIVRDESGIYLRQSGYIRKMMDRFKITRKLSLPAVKNDFVNGDETELQGNDVNLFQSMVGSLLYLASWKRPDISYATNRVAQGMSKPQQRHLQAVERILAYVNFTPNYGLRYKIGRGCGLMEAYSDSDFAEDLESRKSTTGVLLQYAGGSIIWKSHKQHTVAQSTTEAELYALNEAARDIMWAQRLLKSMRDKITPTTLRVDNQAAITLVSDRQYRKSMRYIDTKKLAVIEWIESQFFKVAYIKTAFQKADIFTKPLLKIRFNELVFKLGLNAEA